MIDEVDSTIFVNNHVFYMKYFYVWGKVFLPLEKICDYKFTNY